MKHKFIISFFDCALLLLVLLIPMTVSVHAATGNDAVPLSSTNNSEILSHLTLTESEKRWLGEHHTVRVRVADTPPYQYRSPQASGISVDYIKKAAADLGFAVELNTDDIPWENALNDISGERKLYDLILTIKRTPEREQRIAFTDDYVFVPWVIVSRMDDSIHSAEDLSKRTIALVKGYDVNSRIKEWGHDLSYLDKAKPIDALQAVATSQADAYIGDLSVVNHLIKEQGLYNLKITAGTPFGNHDQAMGVRKDWQVLATLLTSYFHAMSPRDRLAILDRWVKTDSGQDIRPPAPRIALTKLEKAWLKAHPVVTLGGCPNPPFDFVDEKGTITGIAPDYTTLLGDMTGITFRYVSSSLSDMLLKLQNKEIDGVRTIFVEEARARYMNFTEPYVYSIHAIVMRKSSVPAASFSDLSHKRAAVIKNALINHYLESRYPDIALSLSYNTYEEAIGALIKGDVDAVIGPLPVVSWYMEQAYVSDIAVTGIPSESRQAVHIGIRKDWPELVSILDKAIRAVSPEQFRRITRKWISVDLEPPRKKLDLTDEEKQWLTGHPVIRVGSDPAWAPIEFLDNRGEPKGMAMDYLAILEERLRIRFEIIKGLPWHELMDRAKDRSIDMLSCASETPERLSYFYFTTPYVSTPVVMFSRPDMPYVGNLSGLEGKKVVVIQGDVIHETMAREHPEIMLVTAPDIHKALSMLDNDVVAYLGSPLTASFYIMEHGESMIKVVGETPYSYDLAFASRSDWPVFAGILQKALDSISREERNTIYRNWISVTYQHGFDYTLIWKIAGAAMFVAGLIILWNLRLKSEVKKQTATVKANEAFLSNLLETIPNPVFYKDKEGRYLGFNKAFEVFSGMPRSRMIGKTVFDLHPRKLATVFNAKDNELLEDGGVQIYESRLKNARGEEREIIISKAALTDKTGAVTGLIGSVLDITERKRAESALKESEDKLSTLMNNALQGIGISCGNTVEFANAALLKIFGYETMEEFTKVPLMDHVAPESRQFIRNRMAKMARGEQISPMFEYKILKKDGSVRTLQAANSHINFRGETKSFATFMDVTDIKSMEDKLRQSQKMEAIGTLAGGIAHDFNNILSVIIGYADMTLVGLDQGSALRSNINEIRIAGERASELVKQILTFSRRSEQDLQPLNVTLIVKEALKLLRSSIPSTIEIKQSLAQESPLILADPIQVHQVVMNLCTNAYHAMRETGGVLSVTLQPVEFTQNDLQYGPNLVPGGYLDLTICDTGSGIPREALGKIFEPYFTTKPKGQGTGLGLAIVHGIVKSYSGDISVYSEEGKGTAFHIYFPVFESTVDSSPDEEVMTLPTGTERILMVDDDEKIVTMHKKMLERLGYTVKAMTESTAALNTFMDAPDDFDMVITDMTMPLLTGDKLTQKILDQRPDMPVILCTGFSEMINAEKAKALGIKHYMMKPVIQKHLAETVRNIFDRIVPH